jgi:SRSO17 transposase
VQRQYGGALGQKANGQVAVSVPYGSPRGHYPLDLRLYLPDRWRDAKQRLDQAGVPPDQRRALSQPAIALKLLDRVRAEGLPGWAVVADAGYGVAGDFRDGRDARALSYLVGGTEDFVVFRQEPQWEHPGTSGPAGVRGRPRTRPRLAEGSPRPGALAALAQTVRLRRVTGREGTKGKRAGRFAWLRGWPGQGWPVGPCAGKRPRWLLLEAQADGKSTYAFSNLPEGPGLKKAVRLCKSRWPVEPGYQPMKEERGLDHFAGRSGRGFHPHAARVMLAEGVLLLERHRGPEHPVTPEKKGVPSRC